MTQPMPKPGSTNVTPRAREDFPRRLDARERKGVETYGTTLQTFNGRDATEDTLDELIDAYQYVVQIKIQTAQLVKLGNRMALAIELGNLAMANLVAEEWRVLIARMNS